VKETSSPPRHKDTKVHQVFGLLWFCGLATDWTDYADETRRLFKINDVHILERKLKPLSPQRHEDTKVHKAFGFCGLVAWPWIGRISRIDPLTISRCMANKDFTAESEKKNLFTTKAQRHQGAPRNAELKTGYRGAARMVLVQAAIRFSSRSFRHSECTLASSCWNSRCASTAGNASKRSGNCVP
jgi:hypothetical protein